MKYSTDPKEITSRFWDGTVEKEQNDEKVRVILSIHDPEGKKEAIRRAIKDLMARTLTPKHKITKKTENEDETPEQFNQAIESVLLPKIDAWLDRKRKDFSEKEFDEWHRGACEAVLDVLNVYYCNDEKGTPVQYGKAQKIINMTMKGLYCLDGAQNKYFTHCHMALDSFILSWFFRNIVYPRKDADAALKEQKRGWKKDPNIFAEYMTQRANGNLDGEEAKLDKYLLAFSEDWEKFLQDLQRQQMAYVRQYSTIGKRESKQVWNKSVDALQPAWTIRDILYKSYVLSWSVIPEKSAQKAYGYDQYVAWIRSYFKADHPYRTEQNEILTPFQAEFYIWPEMQLRLVTEAFLFELDPKKYKTAKNAEKDRNKLMYLTVEDLLQEAKDSLDAYLI